MLNTNFTFSMYRQTHGQTGRQAPAAEDRPTRSLLPTLILAIAPMWACGPMGGPDAAIETGKEGDSGGKNVHSAFANNGGLRWGSSDDPDIFDSGINYHLEQLPSQGEAKNIPWAANYWPTYKDSINHRWDGSSSQSPAGKYGQAFGVSGVEDAVSSYSGIASLSSRTSCTTTSECNRDLGESCAIRFGESSGYCIPSWFGICHAWAPVSILEPEPRNAVTHNGVTFKVNDLKALLTLAYNRSTSKFVSLRCNENDSEGEIEYDEYGRPTGYDTECLDTNPGTFHVIVANFLGLRNESFVEDRTFDYQVWNQPVRGYRVLSQSEVSAPEANRLVGATSVGGTIHNESGSVAKDEWSHLDSYAVEPGSGVRVVMTGTGDADLYVRFDAQPTSSDYKCRPYEGGTAETCDLTVPSDASRLYVSVNGFDDSSTYDLSITVGGDIPSTYIFNDGAASFYHVKLELDYITESSAGTDGYLGDVIDNYTQSDRYEYVLEVDADGTIAGGEWVGSSQRNHPDFLWLPTGRSKYHSMASGKITYENVKMLLDKSVSDPDS